MSSFKKIFISIKSQIDSIADDFENHEALAEAAINDLQQLAVSTRQHGFRLQKMINRYQAQLIELEKESTLWSERALKVKEQDQQKALLCVKRLRSVNQQIEQLDKQLQAAENQLATVQIDQNAIQQQIVQLKTKKELLSTRQNRNQVQKSIHGYERSAIDVEGVFDRWEGVVVGNEFESVQAVDSLSSSFEKQEDEMELLLMLEELGNDSAKQSERAGE